MGAVCTVGGIKGVLSSSAGLTRHACVLLGDAASCAGNATDVTAGCHVAVGGANRASNGESIALFAIVALRTDQTGRVVDTTREHVIGTGRACGAPTGTTPVSTRRTSYADCFVTVVKIK